MAAVEMASLVLRQVMELATTGALAAGVWEAVAGARAKLRAREIAGRGLATQSDSSMIDKETVDKVLQQLSAADRSKVLESLKQRNPAAVKRYLGDIFSEAVAQPD